MKSAAISANITSNITVNRAIGVMFFVAAMALSAFVRIPVPGSPVPVTMQTFFVLLSGAILGKRFGSGAQIAYVALGACGLPIFQSCGAGFAALFGPTGGYLAGFVLAAYVVGLFARNVKTLIETIAIFTAGIVVIYTCGVLWLSVIYGMNLPSAISAGALPFIPGDITKVLIASLIYMRVSKRARGLF